MTALRVSKGHGTENDFVLLPDLDGELDLTPGLVAALCDRRAGLGGDGVIRVVRTGGGGPGGGAAPGRGAGRRAGRARVVHALPQLRRLAGGDVRQRDPRLRRLPDARGP